MSEELHAPTPGPGRTGVPAVDAVLESVAQAAELPAAEQVAVFERAHETLRRALDDRADAPS
jgi:hypothetical protein